MNMNLQIVKPKTGGYSPLVDFETWRTASLTYAEVVDKHQLKQVERHMETDEVFVLLRGRAVLIIEEAEENFSTMELKPETVYNVRKAVWHHIVLSTDAVVFIVENSNTDTGNSEYKELPRETLDKLLSSIPKL